MHKVLAAIAALFLTLSVAACGNSGSEPEAVTVTSTVPPSSASSTTKASPTRETAAEAASAPHSADSEPVEGNCLVGSMGQPQFQGTTCLDKQVASCGDPGTMESGTTFFTDGSSGWTQQCANVMYPQQQQMQQTQTYEAPSGVDTAGDFVPADPVTPDYADDAPVYHPGVEGVAGDSNIYDAGETGY